MDLFGIKKRRTARIEKYKEQYRASSPEQRMRELDHLEHMVIHSIFRNEAVIEQLTAAAEVEEEEAATP